MSLNGTQVASLYIGYMGINCLRQSVGHILDLKSPKLWQESAQSPLMISDKLLKLVFSIFGKLGLGIIYVNTAAYMWEKGSQSPSALLLAKGVIEAIKSHYHIGFPSIGFLVVSHNINLIKFLDFDPR